MIVAGYMGAVSVVTTVKWFWFLFGMAMFLPVIYSLARTFRETVITRKVRTEPLCDGRIHVAACQPPSCSSRFDVDHPSMSQRASTECRLITSCRTPR